MDVAGGRIRMGADEWTARSQYDGEVFAIGTTVRILQIDGVAVYVGRTAVVSERVDGAAGRVRMGQDEWTARTQLDGECYDVGDEVRIVQIDGPVAYVSHL